LSPRDEDELIAHLRTLDNAGHLQTHTIPQLASALGPGERRASGGLLSAFRRKKKEPEAAMSGCDPDIFAEEIRSYLQRAADKKRELADGIAHVDSGDHIWRAAPIETPSQEIELAQVAAAIPDPEPIHEAAPIQDATPILYAAPIPDETPIQDATPILDAAPIQNAAPGLDVAPSLEVALNLEL